MATGARLGAALTVMLTVDGLLLSIPSLTTNRKLTVPDGGAVNVGRIAVLLDSVTAVPAVWVH